MVHRPKTPFSKFLLLGEMPGGDSQISVVEPFGPCTFLKLLFLWLTVEHSAQFLFRCSILSPASPKERYHDAQGDGSSQ